MTMSNNVQQMNNNNEQQKALHLACHPENGPTDLNMLKALHGAQITSLKDKEGKTPLDYAIPTGNKQVITWLMKEAGATE